MAINYRDLEFMSRSLDSLAQGFASSRKQKLAEREMGLREKESEANISQSKAHQAYWEKKAGEVEQPNLSMDFTDDKGRQYNFKGSPEQWMEFMSRKLGITVSPSPWAAGKKTWLNPIEQAKLSASIHRLNTAREAMAKYRSEKLSQLKPDDPTLKYLQSEIEAATEEIKSYTPGPAEGGENPDNAYTPAQYEPEPDSLKGGPKPMQPGQPPAPGPAAAATQNPSSIPAGGAGYITEKPAFDASSMNRTSVLDSARSPGIRTNQLQAIPSELQTADTEKEAKREKIREDFRRGLITRDQAIEMLRLL